MADGSMIPDAGGVTTPRPDPTVLTTEALRREVSALKELVASDMFSLRELLEEKISHNSELLDDMKVFTAEAHLGLTHEISRAEIIHDQKVVALRDELHATEAVRNQKFEAVQLQFELMEAFRVEQKHDTQAAVDAALAAAKEAVQQQTIASDRSITKSETATSEQLKQMNVTTSTAIQGINLIIDDVKERISRMETLRSGGQDSRTNELQNRADSRGNVALIVAAASVILTLALTVMNAIHIGTH